MYTLLRNRSTRSVSGSCNAILTRFFKEGKYWYIESNPMGTRDNLGFDWGVYQQLYKKPNPSGKLALTGKIKCI